MTKSKGKIKMLSIDSYRMSDRVDSRRFTWTIRKRLKNVRL